jgi:hypothetical protein
MVHEQEGCQVAKQNGSVPGTFVSQGELNDLGKMLTTLRDYIVSHEARIELIEGWILEYHKNYTEAPVEEVEANGTSETEVETFENEGGLVIEPSNDPEEG